MKKLTCILVALMAIHFSAFAQKTDVAKVPAAVQKALKEKFPKAGKADWEMEDGNYEAGFKMDGKEYSVLFDKTGKWLETEKEMKVSDLPAAVVKAINAKYPGCKIKEAEEVETHDKGKRYEVEVMKDKKEMEVLLDPAGKIIKEKMEKEKDKDDND